MKQWSPNVFICPNKGMFKTATLDMMQTTAVLNQIKEKMICKRARKKEKILSKKRKRQRVGKYSVCRKKKSKKKKSKNNKKSLRKHKLSWKKI